MSAMRRARGFTRRQFLGGTLGIAAAWGPTGISTLMGPGSTRTAALEGIYTDRFTYRQGEPIVVHACLSDTGTATISLIRHHTTPSTSAGSFEVHIPRTVASGEPGVDGARFLPVLEIDSTLLGPGIYDVRLPPERMRPETVFNNYNGFPSNNSLARSVVTPAIPASHSRVLWLHDSLTGACYGSFGGQSIYGESSVRRPTISLARPGLDRATEFWGPLRMFLGAGHSFEFMDLCELAAAGPAALAPYDLVVAIGQFEYLSHEIVAALDQYLDTGGHLFAATWEFGAFRVRLDLENRKLTTYKFDFEVTDPLYGSGSSEIAGIGMNIPGTVGETELLGQTVWAARVISTGAPVDLALHHVDVVAPFLAGTGLQAGDSLPAALSWWALGNRIEFGGDGEPLVVDPGLSRTSSDLVVWAVAPSVDGRAWWLSEGMLDDQWPLLPDGHAVATYEERPGGGRMVSLPSSQLATNHLNEPLYQTLLLNILNELS